MSMDAQEAALGLLSMGMSGSGINGTSSSSTTTSGLLGIGIGGGGGVPGGQQAMFQPQQQQQHQRSLHHHHHLSSASSTTVVSPHHQYQHHVHHLQQSPPSTSLSPHPTSHHQQQQHLHAPSHPHHFPPPTSSATLNSILGPPSSSPLIPAKRKIVLLDEGYETGRILRAGMVSGEGIIRDGRDIGLGMTREVQGFGVGYGRVSAQRDEGDVMRMSVPPPSTTSSTAQPRPSSSSSTSMEAFHHRSNSRPSSSSSSGPPTQAFNSYTQPPPPSSTAVKGRVSSPSIYIRGSIPPPTPCSPPPPPPIPVMPTTTPPTRKSKPLPPPDPPPATTSTPGHSEPNSTDGIDCICAINIDDGYSVACDECGTWCHMACFNFPPSGQGQNAASDIEFRCWKCEPRSPGMGVRAREIMKGKIGSGAVKGGGNAGGSGVGNVSQGEDGRRRSPVGSVEGGRKGRKTSAPVSAVGTGEAGSSRRKRRNSGGAGTTPNSVAGPLASSSSSSAVPTASSAVAASTTAAGEEEHVEIDEPWNQAYVHIREDIITDDETRQRLRMHAKNWRGVTAIVEDPSSSSSVQPSQPVLNPKTKLKPIPQNVISSQPLLSPSYTSSHPSILPPSYALHTTTPLSSNSLIIPLKSRISTSTSYLRDPLNSYAHLGMPRPFVHLVGPPLDLSLDGRCVGNEARWVRSGCIPNAVLRPVLCRESKSRRKRMARVEMAKGKEKEKEQEMETERGADRDVEGTEMDLDGGNGKGVVGKGKEKAGDEEDDTTLGFALFATRDLKANEEVVLGWEWDDGNVVHLLPALMNTPGMFSSPTANSNSTRSPSQIVQVRNQMANILHALSSTFATCACGAGSKDCVLQRMKKFVQASSSCISEHSEAMDSRMWVEALKVAIDGTVGGRVDLGPLVGTDKRRGFKARERIPGSGGIGGMEMVPPRLVKGNADVGKTEKGKERVIVDKDFVDNKSAKQRSYVEPQVQHHDLRPFDPGTHEERIHPRMRKKWMKEAMEKRKEDGVISVEKSKQTMSQDELATLAMPPPPMPASMDPTTISSAVEVRRVGEGKVDTSEVVDEANDVVSEKVVQKEVGSENQGETMEVDPPPEDVLMHEVHTTSLAVDVDLPTMTTSVSTSLTIPPSAKSPSPRPTEAHSKESTPLPDAVMRDIESPPSRATTVEPLPSSTTVTVPSPPPTTGSIVADDQGDGDETEDEQDLVVPAIVTGVPEVAEHLVFSQPKSPSPSPQRSQSPSRSCSPPPSDIPASPSTRSPSPVPSPIPQVEVLPPESDEPTLTLPTSYKSNGQPNWASRSPTQSPTTTQGTQTALLVLAANSSVISPRQKPARIDTDLPRAAELEPAMSPTWSPGGGDDGMDAVVDDDTGMEKTDVGDGSSHDMYSEQDDTTPAIAQPPMTDEPNAHPDSSPHDADREPEPTPVPATKKKLSFAEFVARKKKLKEEGHGATTPTTGGMTPILGHGAPLTPTIGPGAALTPMSGANATLAPASGGGTMSMSAGGTDATSLTPTLGSNFNLPSNPSQIGVETSGSSNTSMAGGQTVGLGLGLANLGSISESVSPLSSFSLVVEGEEGDRMVVDENMVPEKKKEDAMKVDNERRVNGKDHGSKENLSPLLSMRDIKDIPSASAISKDTKKLLDSPHHHALSPLIGVGSLNMHMSNGHSSAPIHSLSPVPPSTLGLGLGLGVPSAISLAPSPLSQSPEITTKEAKKEQLDVSLAVNNQGSRKATASPAILSDEHRFSRKMSSPSSPATTPPTFALPSATSLQDDSTQRPSTPPPSSASTSRPVVHAPAPSLASPVGLAPASPIHPDARNWQASPPPQESSLSSPTLPLSRSPIPPRSGVRSQYTASSSLSTSGPSEKNNYAHSRRQSQEDGEIGEHENESDVRRHSSSLHGPPPSSSHFSHSFNTPPPPSTNPTGPKRAVPFPFRTNYGFSPNIPSHGTPSHSPPTHPRSFAIKPSLPSRPGTFNNNNITRSNGVASDADSTTTPTSASASTPTSLKGPPIPSQPSKPTAPATPMSSMPASYGQLPPTAPRALRINSKNPTGRTPQLNAHPHQFHPYANWPQPISNNSASSDNASGPPGLSKAINGPPTTNGISSGPGSEHMIPRGPASQMRDRHKDELDRDYDPSVMSANRDRDRCLPGSRWDSPSGQHRDGPDRDSRDVRDARDPRDGHYSSNGPGMGRYRGGMPPRGRYGGGGSWHEGSHWRK